MLWVSRGSFLTDPSVFSPGRHFANIDRIFPLIFSEGHRTNVFQVIARYIRLLRYSQCPRTLGWYSFSGFRRRHQRNTLSIPPSSMPPHMWGPVKYSNTQSFSNHSLRSGGDPWRPFQYFLTPPRRRNRGDDPRVFSQRGSQEVITHTQSNRTRHQFSILRI